MNSKKAEEMIQQHGLTLLRWNRSFTVATVRVEKGQPFTINNHGGRKKMIEQLKSLPPTAK